MFWKYLILLQASASDCVFVSMLAAREAALTTLRNQFPDQSDNELLSRLVAYTSESVSIKKKIVNIT